MANTEDPDVKITERVEVAPAGDDEELIGEEKETPADSSQPKNTEEEKEEAKEEAKPESEETEETPEEETKESKNAAEIPDEKYGDVKRLDGETNKEFAYRIEIARLREEKRKEQVGEIMQPPPQQAKKELSPEKKKILEKYKPQDIETLKEVFDVMAEDMGFVRQDQLGATNYQTKATEVLDDFLEAHPEYQPKNDPGSVLWNAFRQEFAIYRPTQNPRDLKKILEKVHKEVFGIKPAAALNKQEAAKEKVKVASHSGSSKPQPSREGVRRQATPIQEFRTDMLKGFTDEEIAELTEE
jgi:hypothetical protein